MRANNELKLNPFSNRTFSIGISLSSKESKQSLQNSHSDLRHSVYIDLAVKKFEMAQLFKLNKFLCCLELKLGGIVLGWLSAVLSALGAVFTFVCFIADLEASTISSEKDLVDFIGKPEGRHRNRKNNSKRFLGFGIVCVVYFIFLCGLCFASIQLVRGATNVSCSLLDRFIWNNFFQGNAGQLKLYLILMCIGFVLSFLLVVIVGLNGLIVAVISAILSLYSFICVFSLQEALNGGTETAAA